MVKLLKADGVTYAASATVGFGPLAQGVDQFSFTDLKLTAADSQMSLPHDWRLDVKVRPVEELDSAKKGKHGKQMHEEECMTRNA